MTVMPSQGRSQSRSRSRSRPRSPSPSSRRSLVDLEGLAAYRRDVAQSPAVKSLLMDCTPQRFAPSGADSLASTLTRLRSDLAALESCTPNRDRSRSRSAPLRRELPQADQSASKRRGELEPCDETRASCNRRLREKSPDPNRRAGVSLPLVPDMGNVEDPCSSARESCEEFGSQSSCTSTRRRVRSKRPDPNSCDAARPNAASSLESSCADCFGFGGGVQSTNMTDSAPILRPIVAQSPAVKSLLLECTPGTPKQERARSRSASRASQRLGELEPRCETPCGRRVRGKSPDPHRASVSSPSGADLLASTLTRLRSDLVAVESCTPRQERSWSRSAPLCRDFPQADQLRAEQPRGETRASCNRRIREKSPDPHRPASTSSQLVPDIGDVKDPCGFGFARESCPEPQCQGPCMPAMAKEAPRPMSSSPHLRSMEPSMVRQRVDVPPKATESTDPRQSNKLAEEISHGLRKREEYLKRSERKMSLGCVVC